MPTVSAALVNEFERAFTGHKKYYGQSTPTGKVKENGKFEMKSFTRSEAKGDPTLSWEAYKGHLEGSKGLGIAPINEHNNCRFGVLDVDDYKITPEEFMKIILDYNLPFLLFRSKSGGLHCYIFFAEDIKAINVRDIMKKFLIIFGLPSKTEIFPKQERLFSSSSPSWINLPYFGGTDSYMYSSSCTPVPLEEALMKIHNSRVTWEDLQGTYASLPLNDGPMCLQSLFIRSDSMQDGDGRNNYLFNMGIYYKASDPAEFEESVMAANMRMAEPKDENTILNTIIKPINKQTYSYRCGDHPLCDNCYADLCKERKFGKGGDEISSLSFEELKQVKTNPPHYLWIVNGTEMTFYKERDLREQHVFADQCMQKLHLVPNQIKQRRWVEILNKAFTDIVVEEMDPEDDLSPGSMLWEYFREFILDRPHAQGKKQIKAGYIFKDEEHDIYVFKKSALLKFLEGDKHFRHFSNGEVQKRLFDGGVGAKVYYIEKGWTERVWFVPIRVVKETIKLESDKISFDDMKIDEGEEF